MELKQLRYVTAVAKWNSFSKAAAVLDITQPSLSQHIHKIEQEFDLTIFERTTRLVTVTSEGKRFIAAAEKLLEQVDAFEKAFRNKLNYGLLRVGIIPSVSRWKLRELIPAFCLAYPDIEIEPVEAQGKSLTELLLNLKIDVAISDYGLSDSDERIESLPLFDDILTLIADDRRPIGVNDSVSLSDLRDEKFIFANDENGVHSILNNAFNIAGYKPCQITQCSQIDTVLELVRNQVGVAFFTKKLIEAIKPERIAVLRLIQPIHKPVFLYSLKKQRLKPEIVTFKQFASGWIKENIADAF